MEKRFEDILDELSPEEADRLTEGVSEELDELTKARISKRASAAIGGSGRAKGLSRRGWRAVGAVAACAVLLTGLGFGGRAIAADVKEYNAAKAFFEEYDLPTEGLTRSEVKTIYRDITTESFTYSKTAEIVARNTADKNVEGYQFSPDGAAPGDVKAAWEACIAKWRGLARYECDNHEEFVTENGVETSRFVYATVEKRIGDEVVWSFRTEETSLYRAIETENGVIVSGPSKIIKLTADGEFVWSRPVEGNWVAEVLCNEDGGYTVFSVTNGHSTYNSLMVTKVSADGGTVFAASNTSEKTVLIRKAAHFGEGYLCVCEFCDDNGGNREQKVLRLDGEGRIVESLAYSADGVDYDVRDIMEYGGRLYISANVGTDYDKRAELYEKMDLEGEYEDITDIAKELFGAALLVCDTDGGEPQVFYEVGGAEAYELTVDENGRLVWEVHSLFSATFTPMLSSRTVDGMANVMKYYFDDNGFAEKVDTGDVTVFWK